MGKTKKTRWEDNDISPSKYRSPTRYAETESCDYRDKDELLWTKDESDLTESQMDVYLQCTKHLPKDIALRILRDMDHDIASAVERCNGVELIPDLSLLEQKVLLAAAPMPCAVLGVKNKPTSSAEKHVLSLLPHVSPPAIRNFFNRLGREGCIPPRGWVPRVGHILQPSHDRLMRAGLITADEDSPLYEKPGKRVLRSSTITPEMNTSAMPRKIGRNNLAIAMVGYDQHGVDQPKMMDEEHPSSPDRRLTRTLPMDRFVRSVSIEARPSSTPRPSRDDLPKRGRGRPRKNATSPIRSPLGVSSRPSSPSQIPSSPSSSSLDGSANGSRRRLSNTLDIDMNWSPSDNGARTRRPSSVAMENGSVEWDGKWKMSREDEKQEHSNGKDEPSTSRLSAGSERRGWRDRSPSYKAPSVPPGRRRGTRSSSVFTTASDNESNGTSLSPPKKSRDKLHIAMVGWHQKPNSSTRDRDGFAIPSLPRSPFKSPTRSRQQTLSPPDSPEI